MTPERWDKIKSILGRVLELEEPERPAFLDDACGNDADLRQAVESLMGDADQATTFLRTDSLPKAGNFAPRSSAPDQVGKYRMIRRIGEGGMGQVWLAEQTDPVRRLVAVKIIKSGMDSSQVIARFQAERQALAIMDHPNIAKVFDAGETEDGCPYFVMEYIEGTPLTAHSNQTQLSLAERLDLFRQACEGVQHAHHKSVAHRDLKPSNILVTVVDGKPLVKIIDFGIAKAVHSDSTEQQQFTELGMMLGTPEYMSPEQAQGVADIDTRTDVYSLGVILYELLTGALPFDSRELRRAGYDELRRRIREDDPPKPSARVSGAGGQQTGTARRGGIDKRTLIRKLRGDLDWIVMRALEKERTRRYDSPAALLADIQRHLRQEPVLAGPPSASYRVGRFVRRHRFGVGAAIAAVVLLVAVSITTTMQARRIARERDAAEEAAVMLSTILNSTNPALDSGGTRSIDEVLDALRARLEGSTTMAANPELRARLVDRLGSALHERGRLEDARRVLEHGLNLSQVNPGPDHRLTLRLANQLAYLYTSSGLCEEAEWLHLDVLARQRNALGPEDPETLWSLSNLAFARMAEGRFASAEPLLREVLELRTRVLGSDHRNVLLTRSHLGWVHYQLGLIGTAVQEYREVVDDQHRQFGAEHVDTLDSESVFAMVLSVSGQTEVADSIATRVHETCLNRFGQDHPMTLKATSRLARIRADNGRYASAESILHDALRSEFVAKDPARRQQVLSALAYLHEKSSESIGSGEVLDQLLPLVRADAERCRTDAGSANYHAWLLLSDVELSESDARRALEEAQRANRIVDGSNPNYLDTLAAAHAATGNKDSAIEAALSALELLDDASSPLRRRLEQRVSDLSSMPR